MKLVTKKLYYNQCNLDIVKSLISEGNIYPVVEPIVVEEDGEHYADFRHTWRLEERHETDDFVKVIKTYSFFEHKDEVREWLKDYYDGLVYTD